MFENVPQQPRDAREASDVFYKQKSGDASLNYENEVILTNQMYGENALPYILPENNIRVSFAWHLYVCFLHTLFLLAGSLLCQCQ